MHTIDEFSTLSYPPVIELCCMNNSSIIINYHTKNSNMIHWQSEEKSNWMLSSALSCFRSCRKKDQLKLISLLGKQLVGYSQYPAGVLFHDAATIPGRVVSKCQGLADASIHSYSTDNSKKYVQCMCCVAQTAVYQHSPWEAVQIDGMQINWIYRTIRTLCNPLTRIEYWHRCKWVRWHIRCVRTPALWLQCNNAPCTPSMTPRCSHRHVDDSVITNTSDAHCNLITCFILDKLMIREHIY